MNRPGKVYLCRIRVEFCIRKLVAWFCLIHSPAGEFYLGPKSRENIRFFQLLANL